MSRLHAETYTSDDHTWESPPDIVQAILDFERRAEFDLDPCCTRKNVPAREHYVFPERNGLLEPWHGLVWMNPPYGRLLKMFLAKVTDERYSSPTSLRVWGIIPARPETKYQHELCLRQAGFTVMLQGKVNFLQDGADIGEAPFPVMLTYYGNDWEEKAYRWLKEKPVPGTLMVPFERVAYKL